MKNLVFGLPLLVLGMVSVSQPSFADSVPETSQSAFNKDVLTASKPVVVDFYATWCGPCKKMEPVMESLKKNYSGKATFVRVDVDKNPDLSAKYKITGIPAIFIFKKGEMVDTSVGLVPQEELAKKIDAVVK
jgi:thioredoxin 1